MISQLHQLQTILVSLPSFCGLEVTWQSLGEDTSHRSNIVLRANLSRDWRGLLLITNLLHITYWSHVWMCRTTRGSKALCVPGVFLFRPNHTYENCENVFFTQHVSIIHCLHYFCDYQNQCLHVPFLTLCPQELLDLFCKIYIDILKQPQHELNYETQHDRVITLLAQPQDRKVIAGIFLLLFCLVRQETTTYQGLCWLAWPFSSCLVLSDAGS